MKKKAEQLALIDSDTYWVEPYDLAVELQGAKRRHPATGARRSGVGTGIARGDTLSGSHPSPPRRSPSVRRGRGAAGPPLARHAASPSWTLDTATRDIGRSGVARARELLARSAPDSSAEDSSRPAAPVTAAPSATGSPTTPSRRGGRDAA